MVVGITDIPGAQSFKTPVAYSLGFTKRLMIIVVANCPTMIQKGRTKPVRNMPRLVIRPSVLAGSTFFILDVKSTNGIGMIWTTSVSRIPEMVGMTTYSSPHMIPMKLPMLNTRHLHPSAFAEVSARAVAPPA